MSILELENVSVSFGVGSERVDVLHDVSLQIEQGEFVAILGFAGTGKTTLVNLLAGLEKPTKGQVLFRGERVESPGPERSVVFQSYSLLPWLTVAGNVELAVRAAHRKLSRSACRELSQHYIEMVGLTHAHDRKPAALSGGMRQRVALARTLAMEPAVLLLDEPLSALDALTRTKLQDELQAIWQRDQRTVLLVTNDVDEALYLADRVVLLNSDGTISEQIGVPLPRPRIRSAVNHSSIAIRLKTQITRYLNDQRQVETVSKPRSLPDVTPLHALPKAYREASKTLLTTRYLQFSQLCKTFPTNSGPLTVVEDFELVMEKGEFITLIGHSGCGKSTVLSMTAGLSEISSGAIVLDAKHVVDADPERAVVFQAPSVFPWLSARQNIAIGVNRVYPTATRQEREEVVDYYLERVGLGESADQPARDLSNGTRQLIGIARAFALSPKLLLLDEPFGMLDSLTRWELQDVLMEVWSQAQVTAICVTHDVDEAILLADRVVMMTNGPQARVGHVMEVDLERPRTRKAMLEHPSYIRYREELLCFLEENESGHLLKAS
ncbi:MAG: nitrate ABC transporter ATP-binding protein [Pseudomonadales bacterium]|nr:nitrate ABC transporter ATP-binding protein [Pseudomonadales bacterium]